MKSKRIILGVLAIVCISILGAISYKNSAYRTGTHQSWTTLPREKKARTILCPSWGHSCPSWAHRYDSKDVSFDTLTEESDLIALITVNGIERTYGADGFPFTDFNVTVDKAIYQTEKGQKFIIAMPGQETDTQIIEISGESLMTIGDKALVFCKNNGDGTYRILGGPQGRFAYEDGKLTSIELLTSTISSDEKSTGKIKNVKADKVVKQIEESIQKLDKH